jgi:hypothetical protein
MNLCAGCVHIWLPARWQFRIRPAVRKARAVHVPVSDGRGSGNYPIWHRRSRGQKCQSRVDPQCCHNFPNIVHRTGDDIFWTYLEYPARNGISLLTHLHTSVYITGHGNLI